MIITLRLPGDTPLPMIGGVQERVNSPLGHHWRQTKGLRYTHGKGSFEASYTLDHLALCVGVADYITAARLDNRLSL